MVLRVWTEEGSARPLRVDVRETFDLAQGLGGTLTLADIDDVLAAVRKFVELSGSGGPTAP